MSETFPYMFGKYKIESQLGRGGFGTVYLAQDNKLERPVAIKIMAPALMRDANWVNRFQQEARVMARLDHPNIVPIYEIGEENGRLFLAMKYISGPSLAARIANHNKLEIDKVHSIMGQIADALDYAYHQGVIHRDIKPSNILMNGNTPAMTDFGFARLLKNNSQTFSLSGGIVGTPAYIAPEVWEENEQGRASDIYALGCILYEMLTGEVLFQGDSVPAIMHAHFKPPQFSQNHLNKVPKIYWDTIRTALARDPKERFATATAIVDSFSQTASDMFTAPYANLLRAMKEQRWPDAIQIANNILSKNPDYRDVEAKKSKAQQFLWASEWKEQALSSFNSKDYDAALLSIKRWQEINPDDPVAKDLLKKIKQAQNPPPVSTVPPPIVNDAYSQQIEEPAKFRTNRVKEPVEKSTSARIDYKRVEVLRLKKIASNAISRRDWKTAEKIMTRLKGVAQDDPEIYLLDNRLMSGKEEAEREQNIAFWRNQAKDAVSMQQWDSAEKLVKRWLSLAPDDNEAKHLIDVINNASKEQEAYDEPQEELVYSLPPRKNWTKRILIGTGVLVIVGVFIFIFIVAYFINLNNSSTQTVTKVVEVTRVVEVAIPTPTSNQTLSSLEVKEIKLIIDNVWKAEILARRFLSTSIVDVAFKGEYHTVLVNHISELESLGRYERLYTDFERNYIYDIRSVGNNIRIVEVCEYWRTETYNNLDQLLSGEQNFNLLPQTLTMELFNTPDGPKWFITKIEIHESPSFCQ